MRQKLPVDQTLLINGAALVIVLVALTLAHVSEPANARYLPTRADESDVEVLKDLIRGVS